LQTEPDNTLPGRNAELPTWPAERGTGETDIARFIGEAGARRSTAALSARAARRSLWRLKRWASFRLPSGP